MKISLLLYRRLIILLQKSVIFSKFIFSSQVDFDSNWKKNRIDKKLKENGGGVGGVAVGEMLSPPRVPK